MKKRMISILLTVCLACALLSITVAADATSHIAVSEAAYYDSSLKSIKVTFDWGRSNAEGRLVLMSQRLRSAREDGTNFSYGDFTNVGYYAGKWSDWDTFKQVRDYDQTAVFLASFPIPPNLPWKTV